MNFYAHTHPDFPNSKDAEKHWEPLFTPFGDSEEDCQRETCEKCRDLSPTHGHLNKVAFWAAKFASEMFTKDSEESKSAHAWGYLAGLWHDLGKFAPIWQNYLKSKVDPHIDDVSGKVDHSTAGAQYAKEHIKLFGPLFSYLIAGHHAGLANGIDESDSNLDKRLKKAIPNYLSSVPAEILKIPQPFPAIPFALSSGRSLGFLIRALFSTLVDADFLATEAFMNSWQKDSRPAYNSLPAELEEALDSHLQDLASKAPSTPVNRLRAEILDHCRIAAEKSPGLFSLTVPTGGGKTFSSLAFAVKHARLHGLRRVIYVIPFTSIIEQNASRFREAFANLGPNVVVEHHSNLDPDSAHSTVTSRLASENWDASIIVTTNVQFFESLHANRSSRCRKLHRLARSVIILDEAQTLPLDFLDPCLRSLEELVNHYGSSVVLCTATQPAISRHEDFPIGLASPREIIPEPDRLYESLRRVRAVRLPRKTSDETLIQRVLEHGQALCIVNTRRHARELFERLPKDKSSVHLSALMCPEHRSEMLAFIKDRLTNKLPARLISTQLIEAGVDIDFPVVFRALAGLDSVAQAAGRCDREGLLTATSGQPAGQLFLFEPDKVKAPPFIQTCTNSASQVLASNPPDILGLEAIHDYFRRHYWDNRNSTDQKHISDCYPRHLSEPSDLMCFSFKQCAEDFCLIDDYTEAVLIPHGEKGRALCEQLRQTFDPTEIRQLARKLQRFTVAIPKAQHARLLQAGIVISLHDDRFFLLNSTAHYSDTFGLHPEPDLTLTPNQSIL